MDVLAPLRSSYVQRASGRPATPDHEAPVSLVDDLYVPCFVEAVVSVDPKGRVSLPRGVRSFAATVELGAGPTIKVMFGHENTLTVATMDGRGRLHLPQGLMRTVGMRPGDRVVVIRRADRDAFELVPAGSLRVRHGAA